MATFSFSLKPGGGEGCYFWIFFEDVHFSLELWG